MKKIHRRWLEEFLKNCAATNKSPRTQDNYRADLQKFIFWYEAHFSGALNVANAHTITLYKSALAGEEIREQWEHKSAVQEVAEENLESTPKAQAKKWWQRSWERARSFFSGKKASAPAVTHSPKFLPNPAPYKMAPLSVSSRRRHLSSIKNFFEYLKQANDDHNDLFTVNPVRTKLHAIRLKEEDVVPTKLLTRKDWQALEKAIYRPKERLLVSLLFYGGLRLSEVTHLKVGQFNQERETVTFIRKGGYVHTLRLQNASYLFELLHLHLRFRPHDSEFVFSNKRGKAYSTRAIYSLIVKILLKAKCPTVGLTPHSFRKACATNLYLTTKDLLVVRDYLNHSDAKVTQTYIEMPMDSTLPASL